ncbi:hypothetical protein F2Q70_00038263 [Brassica cretica]|uniref:Uncharacterized protein n=1 Tax=Brassica cretica TaxID=69181 RepID=A0A8S9K221_BRACR|nr:hypothetical protein F2Q70_00038263 [Brassica cretica]
MKYGTRKAAIVAKIKVDSLVAEEYTKNAMVAAYVGSVAPVIDTDDIIELTGQLSELDMLCPSSRRPPGRPHKKPFLSCGQVRMKIPRRRTVCSHCKGEVTVVLVVPAHGRGDLGDGCPRPWARRTSENGPVLGS